MNHANVWIAILGERGPLVGAAVAVIASVPEVEFVTALRNLDRETAIGPLLNSTAYLDGTRNRNAKDWEDVLEALLALRKTLGS